MSRAEGGHDATDGGVITLYATISKIDGRGRRSPSTHGRALITDWARGRKIEGLKIEVVRLAGCTRLILMEVPGAGGDTVPLYGHCDNNTGRPALAVTGVDGIPAVADGGNVLRPKPTLKLSLRLPPTADAARATQRVKDVLEADPPCGARVTFDASERPGSGWSAPAMADWLLDSVKRASTDYFGTPPMFDGFGGSIPFMSMLGERFPQAQFLVTGVMGPGYAHGANEFIDLSTGVKVTPCVAQVLADHARVTPAGR